MACYKNRLNRLHVREACTGPLKENSCRLPALKDEYSNVITGAEISQSLVTNLKRKRVKATRFEHVSDACRKRRRTTEKSASLLQFAVTSARFNDPRVNGRRILPQSDFSKLRSAIASLPTKAPTKKRLNVLINKVGMKLSEQNGRIKRLKQKNVQLKASLLKTLKLVSRSATSTSVAPTNYSAYGSKTTMYRHCQVVHDCMITLTKGDSRKLETLVQILSKRYSLGCTREESVKAMVYEIGEGLISLVGELKSFYKGRYPLQQRVLLQNMALVAVRAANDQMSLSRIAKVVGIKYGILAKADCRWKKFIQDDSLPLWESRGAVRSDKIPDEHAHFIVNEVWFGLTRRSGYRKDCLRNPKLKSDKTLYRKHFLECSIKDLHAQGVLLGKKIWPKFNISLRRFCVLRPFNVVSKKSERCLCRYCLRFTYFYESLLDFRKKFQGLCKCKRPSWESEHELLRDLVCDFKNSACVTRECATCGDHLDKPFQLSSFCPHERSSQEPFSYLKWCPLEKETKDGNSKGISDFIKVVSPLAEILEDFFSFLPFYLYHKETYTVQRDDWKETKNLSVGTVVSVQDFSENYAHSTNLEHQQAYFNGSALTVYTVVLFSRLENWKASKISDDERSQLMERFNGKPPILREEILILSTHMKHDTNMTATCLDVVNSHIIENLENIKIHNGRSDGCAGQFKNASFWAMVANFKPELGAPFYLWWDHFGSGHGKNESDGIGGSFKANARRFETTPYLDLLKQTQDLEDSNSQINTNMLQRQLDLVQEAISETSTWQEKVELDARVLYNWAKAEKPEGYGQPVSGDITKGGYYKRTTYFLSAFPGSSDNSRTGFVQLKVPKYKTIKGTHYIHSIRPVPGNERDMLVLRTRSCHCEMCLNTKYALCKNYQRSSLFRQVKQKIKPETVSKVHTRTRSHIASLAKSVDKQVVFAARVFKEANFQLFLCTKAPYLCKTAHNDKLFGEYMAGDQLVEARGLRRLSNNSRVFHFRDKSDAMYSVTLDVSLVLYTPVQLEKLPYSSKSKATRLAAKENLLALSEAEESAIWSILESMDAVRPQPVKKTPVAPYSSTNGSHPFFSKFQQEGAEKEQPILFSDSPKIDINMEEDETSDIDDPILESFADPTCIESTARCPSCTSGLIRYSSSKKLSCDRFLVDKVQCTRKVHETYTCGAQSRSADCLDFDLCVLCFQELDSPQKLPKKSEIHVKKRCLSISCPKCSSNLVRYSSSKPINCDRVILDGTACRQKICETMTCSGDLLVVDCDFDVCMVCFSELNGETQACKSDIEISAISDVTCQTQLLKSKVEDPTCEPYENLEVSDEAVVFNESQISQNNINETETSGNGIKISDKAVTIRKTQVIESGVSEAQTSERGTKISDKALVTSRSHGFQSDTKRCIVLVKNCPYTTDEILKSVGYKGILKDDLCKVLPSHRLAKTKCPHPTFQNKKYYSTILAFWRKLIDDRELGEQMYFYHSKLLKSMKTIEADGLCFFRAVLKASKFKVFADNGTVCKFRQCVTSWLERALPNAVERVARDTYYYTQKAWVLPTLTAFKTGQTELERSLAEDPVLEFEHGLSRLLGEHFGWGGREMLQFIMSTEEKSEWIGSCSVGVIITNHHDLIQVDASCEVISAINDTTHTSTCPLYMVLSWLLICDKVHETFFIVYNGTNHYDCLVCEHDTDSCETTQVEYRLVKSKERVINDKDVIDLLVE